MWTTSRPSSAVICTVSPVVSPSAPAGAATARTRSVLASVIAPSRRFLTCGVNDGEAVERRDLHGLPRRLRERVGRRRDRANEVVAGERDRRQPQVLEVRREAAGALVVADEAVALERLEQAPDRAGRELQLL